MKADSSSPASAKAGVTWGRSFGAESSGEIFDKEWPEGHDRGADYGCVDLKYGPYDWVHINPWSWISDLGCFLMQEGVWNAYKLRQVSANGTKLATSTYIY